MEDQQQSLNQQEEPKQGKKIFLSTGVTGFDRILRWTWTLFLLGILGIVTLFSLAAFGFFGPLPSVEQLENPELSLATEIIADDSKTVMGKYFRRDRTNVEFDELGDNLVNALISTEDYRYFEHSGIDFKRLLSAALQLGRKGGASTITQQLARNLFTNVDRSSTIKRILQKAKEFVISIQLEKRYSKEEIIALYFNTVGLSDNTYGIKSASRTYFNKEPAFLNISEAATLVGMLKAPTSYNPRLYPDRSKTRRNVVFGQLIKFGGYSNTQLDTLKNLPVKLNYSTSDHNEGLAPYFREYLRGWLAEWIKENKKIDGSDYNIYEDGLKVHTTLNAKMQMFAEEALNETLTDRQTYFYKHWERMGKHPWQYLTKEEREDNEKINDDYLEQAIKRTERYYWESKKRKKSHEDILKIFDEPTKMKIWTENGPADTLMTPKDSLIHYKYILHAGFMAMEPGTGQVKAWVGGRDHRYFKYDNVKPSAKKQVGSTFKPFIYALAVQNGWSPCEKAPNMPVTFDKYDNYTPENVGNFRDGEMLTLKEGLAYSMNRITAYLMKQLNPQQTEAGYVDMVNFFKQMGIKSDILPVPSICLGVADLSIIELVGAYGTFANKGVWVEPHFIKRIEDKHGNVVAEFIPEQVEALDAYSNAAMIELLKNNVANGTGRRLGRAPFDFSHEIAGKTGTTQDNSDGWFMGLTPNLIGGAWMGGDDKYITIKETGLWSGASLSIPIWGRFMKKIYDDGTLNVSVDDVFEMPSELTIELDCEKYDFMNNPNGFGTPGQPQQSVYGQLGTNAQSAGNTTNPQAGQAATTPGTQPAGTGTFKPTQPSIQNDEGYGDEFE